jgi:3-oxoacyl-[acyl-carrier-protein] synthase I
MAPPIFINGFALACAQGVDSKAVARAIFSGNPRPVSGSWTLMGGRTVPAGALGFDLSADLPGETRTNRLAAHLLRELAPFAAAAIERCGPKRVAVLIGSSTSGIEEATGHLATRRRTGAFPTGFNINRQLLGDTSAHVTELTGARGPCWTVSTACTSGAKAIAAGVRLIETGLADAVICGGVDTLADLTLNGFAALESVSAGVCNPFSVNRDGISIGEGGALFVVSRDSGPWRLAGWGESSDAHHISAPDPSGAGAEIAVREALAAPLLAPDAIAHVHAHGTATRLNDQMEAGLINRLFGPERTTSSTKPLTGHTLGAAGAIQAAISLLAMEAGRYPPHLWDGDADPELPPVRLAGTDEHAERPLDHMLSLSFAFGGNNIALALSRG